LGSQPLLQARGHLRRSVSAQATRVQSPVGVATTSAGTRTPASIRFGAGDTVQSPVGVATTSAGTRTPASIRFGAGDTGSKARWGRNHFCRHEDTCVDPFRRRRHGVKGPLGSQPHEDTCVDPFRRRRHGVKVPLGRNHFCRHEDTCVDPFRRRRHGFKVPLGSRHFCRHEDTCARRLHPRSPRLAAPDVAEHSRGDARSADRRVVEGTMSPIRGRRVAHRHREGRGKPVTARI